MVVTNKTYEARPSSPRDLTVQSVDDNPKSVLLRWLSPKQTNGDITGYVIFYTTNNSKSDREWETGAVVGDKTEYILSTGLQPSTTYYFKIQARNSKGVGPFSMTVPYKTVSYKNLESKNNFYLQNKESVLIIFKTNTNLHFQVPGYQAC